MGSGREIAAPRASERCENGSNLLTVIQSIFQRHKDSCLGLKLCCLQSFMRRSMTLEQVLRSKRSPHNKVSHDALRSRCMDDN